MCRAFSCVVVRNGKVYWKLGLDAHEDIKKHFKLGDHKLGVLCAIEITPKNGNYINPDKWIFSFDDDCPDWWKQSHENNVWNAAKQWGKEVDSKIHRDRIKNLINPLNLPMVRKVQNSHIKLLAEWDCVWDSAWDSVEISVEDSVGHSVWVSVWHSVGRSVVDYFRNYDWYASFSRDAMLAYIGWMFKLKRKEWKYTKQIKTKGYPFMSVVKLWKQGLLPSYSCGIWCLRSGKEGKVVFKIEKEKLKYYR